MSTWTNLLDDVTIGERVEFVLFSFPDVDVKMVVVDAVVVFNELQSGNAQ